MKLWCRLYEDHKVQISDGKVVKGIYTPKGRLGWMDSKEVYPYKLDKKTGSWKRCEPALSTLRKGMLNGTYDLM